jgi:hypothetical protein
MDTTTPGIIGQNEWTVYIISFLLLIILFFVQKYAYTIDKKLNLKAHTNSLWVGKPWPLFSGILLGMYTLLYNVFSPNNMQINPLVWRWPEWILVIGFILITGILAYESYAHFGLRFGLIRFTIFLLLVIGFYVAGIYIGLLIVALLALVMLFYFFRFWKKQMVIK